MDNNFSMGTSNWRKWIYSWINKLDSKTTSLQNRIGVGLDFLLVDQWATNASILPTALDQSLLVYDGDVTDVIVQYKSVADGEVFAWQEIITPISQTTIFVHPTTFERYKFNGTTMEIYDDIDNVVPKWLKYEALLTQNGTDAPVARVLNADERDYLGDILFTIPIDFGNSFVANNNKLIKELLFINGEGIDQDGEFCSLRYIDGDSQNGSILFCYTAWGGIKSPSRTDFKLKQRVRGNPPKIVTAETNVEGTKVILTFDKNFNNDIVTNYGNKLQDMIINVDGQGYVAESDSINRNNILELSYLSGGIINGTIVSVSYIPLSNIESLDFGLLQPFYSIPVTNNVPAPPQILNAYTNEAGTEVILEFDKPMAIPTLESTFDTSSNYLYVCMYRNTANETYIALNQEPTIIGNTLIFPCDAILYGDIPYVILLNAIFYASNGLSLENFTDYSLAVQTPYLSISNIFTDGETITMEFDQILDTTSIGDANVFFMIDCNGYTYNVLIDSYIFDNNKLIFTPVVGSLIVGGIAYALEYSGNWAKGIDGSLLSPISTFGNPNVSNYSTIQI